jgi:hypothetical protein
LTPSVSLAGRSPSAEALSISPPGHFAGRRIASERLTVPAVVPRAAEAVDVVWISVPHADEITGVCDLEVDLDDGIWHRAPLAVDDFGEHWKPLPRQTEKFTCGLSWRDSGRGTGGARPRANRFYQRYKSPGVSLGEGEVADERLSKERGECLNLRSLHHVQFPRPQQAYACSWDKPNA